MKLNIRSIHRDLGYFYMGLIISFSFSGILQNHRDAWKPEKYTVTEKSVQIKPLLIDKIEEDQAKQMGEALGIQDKFRKAMIKKGELKISYENHDLQIDLATGKGSIVAYAKTPIISQMHYLHKSTSNWWIYYSDIFGISIIVIAISGSLMIEKGKNTFRLRGWKLAVAGLIFPLLIILFFAL
jgi:hypothetical protein